MGYGAHWAESVVAITNSNANTPNAATDRLKRDMAAYKILWPPEQIGANLAGTDGAVFDAVEYSYQHGQATLVDYLDSQRDYRATYLAYLNLVGAYLTSAGQLNLAVGREIIP